VVVQLAAASVSFQVCICVLAPWLPHPFLSSSPTMCVCFCVYVCVLGVCVRARVCVHALCSERAGSASYEDRLPSRHQSRGRPAHAFDDVEATFGECDGAAAGCRAHSKQSWQAVIIHE
jgi:hypothetical protein